MSKAREIAEERFAKGELTEEEFNKIISKLSITDDSQEQDPNIESLKSNATKKSNKGLKILGTAISIYLAICILFAFAGAAETMAEGTYRKCTDRSHPFCQCQYAASRRQMTFFTVPLIMLDIISLKPSATGCQHLNK